MVKVPANAKEKGNEKNTNRQKIKRWELDILHTLLYMHMHQWFLKVKTCTTIDLKTTHRAHDRSQSSANMFIRSYLTHANHLTPSLKVFQERQDSSKRQNTDS